MEEYTTALGLVAGALTTFSMAPQIFHICKNRSAKDISYKMYIVFTIGVILWITFGIMKDELPIIVTNGVSLVLSFVIMGLKWKFHGASDSD